MSILTEQEINDFDTSKYDHAEISKRDLIRAIEAKVIEKIKAQGPVKAVAVMVSAVGSTYKTPAEDYYRLPEGD